jgi:hypothetical protein
MGGMMPGEMGGYGEGTGGTFGYGPGGALGGTMGSQLSEEDRKYRLFRFFDFSVEPGKHYRYRVALLLWNPNYKVDPQYLESPEFGEKWYVVTNFSDSSGVVTVLRDSEVLAGPVDYSPVRDPKAELGVLHFNVETGLETFADFVCERGQLLNYLDHELDDSKASGVGGGYEGYGDMMGDYGDLMEGGPEMGMGMPGMGPPRPSKSSDDEEPETIDFVTETVLLDIRGGGKLPGRDRDITEAGRVLLLDDVGRLIVRDELEDAEIYLAHKPPEREKTSPSREGPGMPGMPGMMPGDYEGGEDYDYLMDGYEEGGRNRRGRGR